jgi:hypothetical protein
MEVDEGGAMPSPGEDTVMMIYDGHPSLGVCHMSDPGLGAPARHGWGCGDAGM